MKRKDRVFQTRNATPNIILRAGYCGAFSNYERARAYKRILEKKGKRLYIGASRAGNENRLLYHLVPKGKIWVGVKRVYK